MKKLLALGLVLILMLSACACGKEEKVEPPTPVANPTAPTVSTVYISAESLKNVMLINARANDSSTLELEENMHLLARAVLPGKDTTVDHWEINGKQVDSGGRRYTLEFDTDETDVVSAILREKKSVACVNSYITFLDSKGNDIGKKYKRVRFEDDYTIPVTGEAHAGGTITCRITADVPEGMEVDYWLFNGVAYRFDNQNVVSFVVVGLNVDMVYEPIFCPATGRAPIYSIIEAFDPGFNNINTQLFDDDYPSYFDDSFEEADPSNEGREDYDGPVNTGTQEAPKEHEHNFQLDGAASQTDNGHVFACQSSYTEPHSYDENGVCTVCGHQTHIHHFKVVTDKAGGQGHLKRCSGCGYEYTESHSFTYSFASTFNGHTCRCTICGYTDSEPHSFAYTDNNDRSTHTCRCTVCGYSWEEGHSIEYDQFGSGHCTKCEYYWI